MPLAPYLPDYAGAVSDRPQLYDLDADPGEARDVAADHPDVVVRLTAAYAGWFSEVEAEWRAARERIVDHDEASWRHRTPPDPQKLFPDGKR